MSAKITLLLVLALFSVSTSPIIAKALVGVNAVAISFWRMLFAAFILWFYSFLKPQGKMKVKSNIRKTVIAGVLLGIHFALFFSAVKITQIANATFLGTLAPFFTLIVEIFIFKRSFDSKVLIGLLFTLFGSLIILGYKFDFGTSYTLGNLLALSCSICLGIAFIISEKVRESESTVVYTRTLYLTAAITLIFIGLISNENLINFTYWEYLGLLFLGLVPTLLGHNAIYYSVKYVSPTIVAAFPIGEPIIATILAYFIFGELIGFNILFGGVVTFTGLLLISIKKK